MEVLNTPTVRVLIVDDDPLVRAGLRLILGPADGVRVVGEVGDGDEVREAVANCRPDVVLMDLRMRRVDGLTATEWLRELIDPPAVLVLTTFDADEQVLRALRAGASGFVLKDTPPRSADRRDPQRRCWGLGAVAVGGAAADHPRRRRRGDDEA